MKYRYRFHPYEYALGENEKFYSDMEAKGWRLVKRGGYLSKFAPAAPARTRYRIEVVQSNYMENGCTMPPEQRAVYEDCGWEYVSGRNLLHIFRAPEGSDAPEFYADPAEQAATLKSLRQQAFLAGLPFLVILLCNMFLANGGPQRTLSLWYRGLIEQSAVMLLCYIVIIQALCSMAVNAWRINRTYRRLKKGVPLNHSPRSRLASRPYIGPLALGVTLSALIVLSIVQFGGTRSQDLPLEADGPYLLLRDLGYEGERRPAYNSGDPESGMTHTSSLLADYWDIFETVGDESHNAWLYQDIYRLRSPRMADSLVTVLRRTTAFGSGPEDCTRYVMDDMEAWAYQEVEIIVVQGNMVAHITGWNSGYEESVQQLLTALRQRWTE